MADPNAEELPFDNLPDDEENEEVDEEVENEDEEYEASAGTEDPEVQKAMAQGWRPKEEWDGDPEDWVDHKEFNRRGELMDRIKQQSRQLRQNEKNIEDLRQALNELGEHNKKIAEQEYKNALNDLKKQKREALDEGDSDAVIAIDDQIDDLKDTYSGDKAAKESKKENDDEDKAQTPPPEVLEWKQRNQWYDNDKVMQAAANAIGQEIYDSDPNTPINEALEEVERRIRAEFPHKFNDRQQRRKSKTLESNGSASQKKQGKQAKFTEKDLNETQRGMAKTFVESGAFESVQEYVDQLAEIGELDKQKGA